MTHNVKTTGLAGGLKLSGSLFVGGVEDAAPDHSGAAVLWGYCAFQVSLPP